MLLKARSLFPETYWYWIGVGALLGYTVLFNILYTLFLTYLNPLGNRQVVICDKEAEVGSSRMQGECDVIELREYLQHSHSFSGKIIKDQRRMVLPFQPLSMSFRDISYYVDTHVELKQQGVTEDRL
ncbi:hypothetical protein POM88_025061 [Heracleum sosnowskyi]|uniref:Plant PDR ABC transporter associated domain-containing protein n=1 Tax=Heracleum sosnowskyi TaxID=360622 RepID=A0AAD8MML1_9APIA|nr:hypothetical protein POM88_025061 [Heracleum sosnowskyi]